MSVIYVPTHPIYNCETKTESLQGEKKRPFSKREWGNTKVSSP